MKKIRLTIKNIFAFIIGNVRYNLYYSKCSFLIRSHIFDQIEWRIRVMNKECYTQGSCVMCGCTTTALQMANKMCDKPCYPPMMSKKKWIKFSAGETVKIGNDTWSAYNKERLGSLHIFVAKNGETISGKSIK